MIAKSDIYNNTSLQTMTSLDKNNDNEELKETPKSEDSDLNEISMELTPVKSSSKDESVSKSDSKTRKNSIWVEPLEVLSNNHIGTPEDVSTQKLNPKTPYKTPQGKCDYAHINLCKKFEFEVCDPNNPKVIAKSDIANLYNNISSQAMTSVNGKTNEDHKEEHKIKDSKLNEISLEANPCCSKEENVSNAAIKISEISVSNESPLLNHNHISTPGIPGKLNVKKDLYKTTEERSDSSPEAKGTQNVEEVKNPEKKKTDTPDLIPLDITNPECNTLWLSATNLGQFNEENDENKDPNKPEAANELKSPAPAQKVENPESPKPTRRVSIVMPTPILKRTNVKMKFQIPGRFSSTPIMSSGLVKIKQTKTVEEISTRIIHPKTPYKTPRGKCEYSYLNPGRKFEFEAGPSDAYGDEIVACSKILGDSSEPCQELVPLQTVQEQSSSVSVSSMTESNIWSSMTRIVKSVFGGFSSISNDSNISTTSSSSFKRQLSDSDDGLAEAPRLKRFKFTDIKCRRPIRDLPAIEAAPTLGEVQRYGRQARAGVATLEIVKSVSTLYGGPRVRVQCDKATQTDDYLMNGWQPRS